MDSKTYRDEIKILLINGSALLGAYALKRGTELVLEKVFDKVPPEKPEEQQDIGWIKAIGWAAFTGAMTGALELIIRRGTKNQLDKVL